MRGSELVAQGTASLNAAGVPDAGRDARRLFAFVLGIPAGRVTLFLPEDVTPEAAEKFTALVTRRAAREPVSHLIGRRLFYGREFLVTPDVLDPRPETETLIEAALAQPFDTVLDMGTGSGCILLTLLLEQDNASGLGTDLSQEALNVAYWNRNALQLKDRAGLAQGSWFTALPDPEARFDLIVSNPPYIGLTEMPDLSPEVRNYEPRMALTDEADGLNAYRAILAQAPQYLQPNGRILVEIGPTQGAAVAAMMRAAGLVSVVVIPDLDGRDRVVSGVQSTK